MAGPFFLTCTWLSQMRRRANRTNAKSVCPFLLADAMRRPYQSFPQLLQSTLVAVGGRVCLEIKFIMISVGSRIVSSKPKSFSLAAVGDDLVFRTQKIYLIVQRPWWRCKTCCPCGAE